MRTIRDLPTLDQVNARPHATPKGELQTRLDRAIASKSARLADQRELRAWALAVKARDNWTDRYTGQRLRRCLELDPLRAEAHHLAGRDDWTVRHDPRNGITVSFATHDAIERGRLRVEGTRFFRIHGTRYIDGDYPVVFVRT